MVHLIFGEEPYLIFKKAKELLSNDYQVFDLEVNQSDDFILKVKSLSFFNQTNFLVKNFSILGLKKLRELLKTVSSSQIIFVFYQEGNIKKDIEKIFKEAKAKVIEFEKLRGIKFIKFAREELKNSKLKITPKAVQLLTEIYKDKLDFFVTELEKLKNVPTKIIDIETIKIYCRLPLEEKVFDLIDSILAKNKKEALIFLQREIDASTDALAIMGLLISSFRNMIILKLGKIPDAHPYVIKKLGSLLNRFSQAELENYFKLLADLDFKIKTGEIEKEKALEDFILAMN